MNKYLALFVSLLFIQACAPNENQSVQNTAPAALKAGHWRVVMHSPGGELPFSLVVSQNGSQLKAHIGNGSEQLPVDILEVEQNTVTFGIAHYESVFKGTLSAQGSRIDGEWTKVVGADKISKLPFHADHGQTHRFTLPQNIQPIDVNGTWSVMFENGEDDPYEAVGRFTQNGTQLEGTFLTTTGDYRFLAGNVSDKGLMLSCFDGGHAFLFTAQLNEQQQLEGHFWSRDTWHDTWTAQPNPDATLPDAYTQTKLKGDGTTFRFSFPNLEGETITQDHESLKGKVRLITIFGSWCPNCNDEAPLLQEFYDRYRERGFEVMGLAYEMTGNPDRDIRVLNRFKKRHKLNYPILLAGGSTDKQKAADSLPDMDTLLSYPTTLLIDRNGKVISVHTGFTGPGTGQDYQSLKNNYQKKIEALL